MLSKTKETKPRLLLVTGHRQPVTDSKTSTNGLVFLLKLIFDYCCMARRVESRIAELQNENRNSAICTHKRKQSASGVIKAVDSKTKETNTPFLLVTDSKTSTHGLVFLSHPIISMPILLSYPFIFLLCPQVTLDIEDLYRTHYPFA